MDPPGKSIRTLNIMRVCMLIAIGWNFAFTIRHPVANPAPRLRSFEIIVTVLALSCVITVFLFHRKYVGKAEDSLRRKPGDEAAARRLHVGYIVIYASSLAVALYGLVLHFCGVPALWVVPFFVVGALLTVWFRPVREGM